MTTGDGLALLGAWLAVAAAAYSPTVTGIGFVWTMMGAMLATAIVAAM